MYYSEENQNLPQKQVYKNYGSKYSFVESKN